MARIQIPMKPAALPARLLAAWAMPTAFVIASVELQHNWNSPLKWAYGLVVVLYATIWIASLLEKDWAWSVSSTVIDAGIALMAAAGLILLAAGQTIPGQQALQSLLLWSPLICAWWATRHYGQSLRTATIVIAFYLVTLPGGWPDQLSLYFQHAFQGVLLIFVLPIFFDALVAARINQGSLSADAWMRDEDTGVANRSYIEAELAHLAAMASRYGLPFAVILIEVGNSESAQLMRDCAWRIVERVRRPDTVCRWECRRFLVLLPNTTAADALRVATDIEMALHNLTPARSAVSAHPNGGEALAAVDLAEQAISHPTGAPTTGNHPEARLPF